MGEAHIDDIKLSAPSVDDLAASIERLADATSDIPLPPLAIDNKEVAHKARPTLPHSARYGYKRPFVWATLLLAILCLGWVSWIMALTAAPTEMINRVMKTMKLDFGEFWRLSPASGGVVGIGLAVLAMVGIGYVVVLGKLVVILVTQTVSRRKSRTASRIGSRVGSYTTKKIQAMSQQPKSEITSRQWSANVMRRASSFTMEVLNRESVTRRRMHTIVKVIDLFIQCVFLAQLLEQGMPVSLLAVFAATVALNALSATVMFLLPHDNVGRPQILVDIFFDFMIAIVFPVLVLAYTLNTFTFDQKVMDVNLKTFPPGFFERYAAVVADPVEVESIRGTLDSLRIDSVLKIVTRVGTHFALSRRFFSLVEFLEAERKGHGSHPNLYPKKNYPVAGLFFAVAILVIVYTAGSVHTTNLACRPHPECVQIARHWVSNYKSGELDRCPCLTYIDENVTIATFDEWTTPHNRTEKLGQLANAGYLLTVQLVNRGLTFFPDELRECTNLKHVSLYYTDTLTMPDWFGEFKELEFLHIEAKSLDKTLHSLPGHLFDKLAKLSYIHLAFLAVPQLPSLDGLVGLRSLTIAVLPFVTALPSFSHLLNLERLTASCMTGLEAFADLTNVKHLKALVVSDRGAFCCNGFLGADKCNLNHSLCRLHPLWGTPAVTQCLSADRVASSATRKYFDEFPFSACYGEALQPGQLKLLPTPEEMIQCNGTMYRECHAPGHNGSAMCYNARWMAVACDPSPFAIKMRELQIAERVGQPCNPEYEAWLGCTN